MIYANIGGQETTAMANACVIFMLAHHQDVQDKVNIIYTSVSCAYCI